MPNFETFLRSMETTGFPGVSYESSIAIGAQLGQIYCVAARWVYLALLYRSYVSCDTESTYPRVHLCRILLRE